MVVKGFYALIVVSLIVILQACASLAPSFEKPVVSISSFRSIPSDSMNPQFEIGLHIVNPNNIDLNLQGVAYTVTIAGHTILTGASHDLPLIPAYGEGDVTLKASADLLGSLRLIASVLKNQHQQLDYQLDVKLDVGDFIPAIRVEKHGEISMPGKVRQ